MKTPDIEKKLFEVEISATIPVFAMTAREAEQIALDIVHEVDDWDAGVCEIKDLKKYWGDRDAEPFGSDDGLTIAQWVEAKKALPPTQKELEERGQLRLQA